MRVSGPYDWLFSDGLEGSSLPLSIVILADRLCFLSFLDADVLAQPIV